MKSITRAVGLLFLACILIVPVLLSQSGPPSKPPAARARPVTDKYFGVELSDPYRYMEDLKTPEVEQWIKAQAEYTKATLERLPGRGALLGEMQKYDNASPARVSSVQRLVGDRYFYLKTLSGQNLAKLYLRKGLQGKEKLLVDTDQYKGPNSEPGAINYYAPSPDGKYVAYGISIGGSEMTTLRVLDLQTGKNLPEEIDRILIGEGAVFWTPDSRGFFYNRLRKLAPGAPPTELEQKSKNYLHIVGEAPEKDKAVLGFELSKNVEVSPIDFPIVSAQPGSEYVIGILAHGVQNESTLYAAPLSAFNKPEIAWVKICDVDAEVTDASVHGDEIYLLTHKDASRFKLIRTSLSHPDVAQAEVVVSQGRGVLRSPTPAADALYL